jgi:HEPN superfamily AbiU2-like protein
MSPGCLALGTAMTVQETVSKLKGMAENLRGNFAETTALFHMAQMSANEDVRDRFLASEKADGFKVIRTALHRSLILQLASANFDDSKNKFNPSITALLSRISPDAKGSNTKLVGYLEDQFVRSAPGSGRNSRAVFKLALRQALDIWKDVKDSKPWGGLKTLRDKVIAHTDLIFVDGSAGTIDIAGAGLAIEDLPNIHEKTQDLVERVHSIITGKIPDYSVTNKTGRLAAEKFWKL